MDQYLICLETEVSNEHLLYCNAGELSIDELDALVVELQKTNPAKLIWILNGPVFLN
jgi:hypothetical protein